METARADYTIEYFDDIWQREARRIKVNNIIKIGIFVTIIFSISFGIYKWLKENQASTVNSELAKLVKNSDERVESKVQKLLQVEKDIQIKRALEIKKKLEQTRKEEREERMTEIIVKFEDSNV